MAPPQPASHRSQGGPQSGRRGARRPSLGQVPGLPAAPGAGGPLRFRPQELGGHLAAQDSSGGVGRSGGKQRRTSGPGAGSLSSSHSATHVTCWVSAPHLGHGTGLAGLRRGITGPARAPQGTASPRTQ